MSTNSRFFRSTPLGMNHRNYIIRSVNPGAALRVARDKVAFKQLLEANDIPTPRTHHVIHDFTDMRLVSALPHEFVVKPAKSLAGRGVMLLEEEGSGYVNPSGDRFSARAIMLHIRKILDGDFSGHTEPDQAIIEERIYPSEKLRFKDALGLPDIRIVCYNFEPVLAMLRYPTLQSKGRSNLSVGALGIGLNLANGAITYVHSKKEHREYAFQDWHIPPAFAMPRWEEMKLTAHRSSELAGLKLSGVDLVLDTSDNVLVLEINGRPGLEIQNITEYSLQTAIGDWAAGRGKEKTEVFQQ